MSFAFDHAILFTGHMIDSPGRSAERFPSRAETPARRAIQNAVKNLLALHPRPAATIGIAGGASGGDLLFHEVCAQLGVPTRLYLALPAAEYAKKSVEPAGGDWPQRFHNLLGRLNPSSIKVLDDSLVLPANVQPNRLIGGENPSDLNIWQRTNLWMAAEAIVLAPRRTLLALWDGNAGDGPGGTEHLIQAAPQLGIEVAQIIATQRLFN